MHVLTHDKLEYNNVCEHSEHRSLLIRVRPTSERWCLKIVQVTIEHDQFDAM